MKTITVVASNHVSKWAWMSKAIKSIEGVGFSHISFIFRDGYLEREICYETTLFEGAHFLSIPQFLKSHSGVFYWTIEVEEKYFKQMYAYLWDHEGTPYGFWQCVGILWIRIMRKWFKKRVSNPFQNAEKRTICVETVGRALEKLEVVPEGRYNWDDCGLKEIKKFLDDYCARVKAMREINQSS